MPAALREVSGIVKDSTGAFIPGALIELKSIKDTLKTAINEYGIFTFQNVKQAVFTLTISSIGYRTLVRKFLNNDLSDMIVLDPIILRDDQRILNEVNIKGKVGIIYKTDTIEYRASDYKVRAYASVGDLLKKMEGVEVSNDGRVTHNGEAVKKAKFNGIDYFGGDIKNATIELPADIVEKIQFIDDYGDKAARTGIKDGNPLKTLNIVSKADKSVGTLAEVVAELGQQKRYKANVGIKRIEGAKQIGAAANLDQRLAGVTNNVSGAAENANGSADISGGYLKNKSADLSYRNQFNKKVVLQGSYKYRLEDQDVDKNSLSEEIFNTGLIRSNNTSKINTSKQQHTFNGKVEYNITPATWLIVNPYLSYNKSNWQNFDVKAQSGAIHVNQYTKNQTNFRNPEFGATVLLGHNFEEKGKVLSMEIAAHQKLQSETKNNSDSLIYFNASGLQETEFIQHFLIRDKNPYQNYRASFTFSKPITEKTKLELNIQSSVKDYHNRRQTYNLSVSADEQIDSLSNIIDYTFVENKFYLNYKLEKETFKATFGLVAMPVYLNGSSFISGNKISRSMFRLVPNLRMDYYPSRQSRLSVSYMANVIEPQFEEIQAGRDASNSQNIIHGNPDLKSGMRHSLSVNLNSYLSRARMNIALNLSGMLLENSISRNILLVPDQFNQLKRETYFQNTNGNYSLYSYHNLSKSIGDYSLKIELNGLTTYNRAVSLSNSKENLSESWTSRQRLKLQTIPWDWLEVNPGVGFLLNKTNFSLSPASAISRKTYSINMDAVVFFDKTFYLSFDAEKYMVKGIAFNETVNPFIVNLSISKRLFPRKNATVGLKAFDLLKQNNFINRMLTPNGYADSRTNVSSRYVTVNFTWRPQVWSGGKKVNNKRHGDGSFMPD
ncbi:outer membrane beta-barrel protein [Pedobacter africanus]|uniref:Uncharacterized protein n=1 Tax=Pedobacter africanus TaxID=151894 RepID=A0ACC6KXU3_9SPHI|nr:outer membrane beta-barrel protein [Pedobacter africanus]MDR6783990.1 hypothetical protein [Pedobacter africanus]